MALTATANLETRKNVIENLEMTLKPKIQIKSTLSIWLQKNLKM